MLNSEQKKHFISLRVELIDLNICTNFFVRKINRYAYIWKETSRAFVLEELTALRYLENGIILHLTNLDDDNSEFSFRTAATEYNKTSKDPKKIKQLKESLKLYRKHLQDLKGRHRNRRIAHMNSNDDLQYDQFLNFSSELLPLILEANEIADRLWGEKIGMHFTLGSWEGVLDFKKHLPELKVNGKSIQSFTSNKMLE